MRILVIGQCTLQKGRMEYGNIGNYYIVEPFFRELHRAFPMAEIVTSFQMTDTFCEREKVTCLPIDIYYSWNEDNYLDIALKELGIATIYSKTGKLTALTLYIEEVMKSDLVIDFSGDMWGENANILGKDRYLVGLIKDRVAQLLGRPTAMLAGSPGPFENNNISFASEVFRNFDLVTNREQRSRYVLKEQGFNDSNVVETACPAFLFEAKTSKEVESVIEELRQKKKQGPVIGLVICGWNMKEGPYSKWPRSENEYSSIIQAVEYIESELNASVYLLSHSNGFEIDPEFKVIHGRDYLMVQQLYDILKERPNSENVFLLNGIYLPAQTKAIIKEFDMLISGRVHAAVAGWSQCVPTVVLDYGHEPKAHKLKGFAQMVGFEELVADPIDFDDIKSKIDQCWKNRVQINKKLQETITEVQKKARLNFDLLKDLVNKNH